MQRPSRTEMEAYAARYTRMELARATGAQPRTVMRWEDHYDIKCRPSVRGRPLGTVGIEVKNPSKRPPKEEFQRLAEKYTKVQIAQIRGCTPRCVADWEKVYGIKAKPTPNLGRFEPKRKLKVKSSHALRSIVPAAPKPEKKRDPNELRAAIADDVTAFLARGGRISVGPAPGSDPGRPRARVHGLQYP